MAKFLVGVLFAFFLIGAFSYVFAFQIFRSPVPMNGEQLKQVWADTAKDSHGRWELVEVTPDGFVLYLEYPIKRYKFIVPRGDIALRTNIDSLPKVINAKDIALTKDPEHSFAK